MIKFTFKIMIGFEVIVESVKPIASVDELLDVAKSGLVQRIVCFYLLLHRGTLGQKV